LLVIGDAGSVRAHALTARKAEAEDADSQQQLQQKKTGPSLRHPSFSFLASRSITGHVSWPSSIVEGQEDTLDLGEQMEKQRAVHLSKAAAHRFLVEGIAQMHLSSARVVAARLRCRRAACSASLALGCPMVMLCSAVSPDRQTETAAGAAAGGGGGGAAAAAVRRAL
jgi:hypothetical protein